MNLPGKVARHTHRHFSLFVPLLRSKIASVEKDNWWNDVLICLIACFYIVSFDILMSTISYLLTFILNWCFSSYSLVGMLLFVLHNVCTGFSSIPSIVFSLDSLHSSIFQFSRCYIASSALGDFSAEIYLYITMPSQPCYFSLLLLFCSFLLLFNLKVFFEKNLKKNDTKNIGSPMLLGLF